VVVHKEGDQVAVLVGGGHPYRFVFVVHLTLHSRSRRDRRRRGQFGLRKCRSGRAPRTSPSRCPSRGHPPSRTPASRWSRPAPTSRAARSGSWPPAPPRTTPRSP